jgi:hypothetical protein
LVSFVGQPPRLLAFLKADTVITAYPIPVSLARALNQEDGLTSEVISPLVICNSPINRLYAIRSFVN